MKKILILSGLKIFPNTSGGHLRSGSVAKSLARLGNEVCIYSLAGRRDDYGQGTQMLYQGIEENLVEEVNLTYSFGLIQSLSRRLGLPRVWQYLMLGLGLVPKTLRNRLRWADIIICDLPYTPKVPGAFGKKTWILLSHNLEHRLLAQGSRIERFFSPWMERREMVASLQYDGILACAKEDADYFRARSPEPEQIRLVANGIDPDLYQQSIDAGQKIRRELGVSQEETLIVFSGSRFQPNLDALNQLEGFIEREKSFLVKAKIRFLILGSLSPIQDIQKFLIKTGPVAETYPYFAAADAALNPVQTGSGSNVKIFEYLAAKLPVISTKFGTRGTALVAGRDYLGFENDAELKARLNDLVQNQTKEEWKAFAERVWERVEDSCDMTAILKKEWRGLRLQSKTPSPLSLLTGTRTR